MDNDKETPTRRVNPVFLHVVQVIVAAVTVFLLVSHVLKWDEIQVDTTTLALVGLLLVIPLVELIRKVKLGEFEAEIGRDEVAKARAKASTELSSSANEELDVSEKEIRQLLRTDPRLAMAKVRIELEDSMKRLYLATIHTEPDLRRMSVSRLADALVQKQVLTPPIAASVRDVITLANRAVHGERVEPDAAEELAILGVRLVYEIRQTYLEHILNPVQKEVIATEQVDQYRSARYRVTTIVPLVRNPTKNVYVFDQDALESFLEGYEEYAEFVVAVEQT